MLHRRPIAGLAVAVVVVSGGLASAATGANAATDKAHTPKCFGKTATIVVTGNNKTVRAPKGKAHRTGSVVVALGKGDKVYGGDGNDKICVGNAHSVDAGKGDDSVQFTTGTIHGNDGNDLLQQVGKGNATAYGDAGNDKIKLAKGTSSAHGGVGNDSLSVGASGNQKLYGDAGSDNFYAGGATATLDGGADDDSFTVSGVAAPHTFVVPGAGDKVNGQYVRVDASKDGSTATLAFNDFPAPVAYATTQLPGDVVGQDGGVLSIAGALAPVGKNFVQWSINFGDGSPVLAGHGAPPSSTPHSFITDRANVVTVTATDTSGQSTVRSITVLSAKPPTAKLTNTVSGGTAVFSTAAAADPGVSAISAYALDFGDGSDPASAATAPPAQLQHVYPPGSYSATLTVVDDHGSTITSSSPVTVANTASGPPVAVLRLAKRVNLSGPVALAGTTVVVGGGAAHTLEVGQNVEYAVEASASADPGDTFDITGERIDLGDGRGVRTIFDETTPVTSSDAGADGSGSIAYSAPGPKTITLTVTESGYDSNFNRLPDRTTTVSQVVNVISGQVTAQLSAPSGPEGVFTGLTAGTSAPAGAAITFYALAGPNGFLQYGAGAPPATVTRSLTPLNGQFTLVVLDSLGNNAFAETRGIVTADHPLVGETQFTGNTTSARWAPESAGVGPDDQTVGGLASSFAVPSYGSRITGATIQYGDGAVVTNPSGSLTGVIGSPADHVYTTPGDYQLTVTATDSTKKSASNAMIVSVAGKPTLAVAGNNVATGSPTTFTTSPGYGANAGPLAWMMSFDDSTPDVGGYGPVPPSFTHVFAKAGSHSVAVTILNDHFAQTLRTVTVTDS